MVLRDTGEPVISRALRLAIPCLALHVAATTAAAAVITPIVGIAARLAAGLSGAPAIADQDIARLAFSPIGFLALLAVAAIVITANVVGLSAMIALDADDRRGIPPSVWRAARRTASRTPAILALAGVVVMRLLLRAAPFLIAGFLIARTLLSEHDVNFYLSERPPEFLRAAAFGAILAAGLVAVLGERFAAWALALPGVVLGGLQPRAALRESLWLTRGRRLKVASGLGLWAIASLGLTLGGASAAGLAAQALAPASDAGLQAVAVHVLGALAVIAAVNVVTGAAATGGLASLLGGLHAGFGGAENLPPVLSAPPRRAAQSALLLVAGVAGAISAGVALSAGLRTTQDVAIIAHRGHGAAPENTLPAIEMGIRAGADWIEIDVQETVDGSVVLMHDRDFMKLAGAPLQVADATLAEVRSIDIGASFDAAFTGVTAPTLEEALETVRGRARLLIELKHYGRAVRLEARVADIVEAARMAEDVAVMSLDHASAARMKALQPDWRVGVLAATALGDLTRLDADFLAVGTRLAAPPLIRRARRAGVDLYAWTVNDPVAMSRFVSLGVSGLITDEPGRARAVLAARAEMSAAERLALLAADLFGAGRRPEFARAASP
jgi:glycerophosphoryl diester phosphodiesterase